MLTTATLDWFCRQRGDDARWLEKWRAVPTSYQLGQTTDESWHHDHHEVILLAQANEGQFQYGADQLMRYHFYPHKVMTHISDFSVGDRWVEVGDRLVQRIQAFSPLFDIISMTEIAAVTKEARRVGFTYVTVATHCEWGEWSVFLTWLETGALKLTLLATSRPVRREPRRNYPVMRAVQKWAHQQGIASFQQMVTNFAK